MYENCLNLLFSSTVLYFYIGPLYLIEARPFTHTKHLTMLVITKYSHACMILFIEFYSVEDLNMILALKYSLNRIPGCILESGRRIQFPVIKVLLSLKKKLLFYSPSRYKVSLTVVNYNY